MFPSLVLIFLSGTKEERSRLKQAGRGGTGMVFRDKKLKRWWLNIPD
jgi:hypothetical protein